VDDHPNHGLVIRNDGSKIWYLYGKIHRLDGPAVLLSNGVTQWWVDNKRHRTDGPAIEYGDGDRSWWLHGNWLPFAAWLKENDELSDGEKVMMKLQYG
jgi:hypothetical protein